MNTETQSTPQSFFRRWLLATFGGWMLGVVIIILLAEALESVHLGEQFPIGIGMGLGIGFGQWRVARKWFAANSQWMWATLVGIGIPFLLSDVFGIWAERSMVVLILVNVAVGGLIVGIWQRRILQPHSVKPNLWIPACIIGWMLAAAAPLLLLVGGHPKSSLALWRNIGAIALGGVVLGVVTAGALVWLLQPSKTNSTAAPPTNA